MAQGELTRVIAELQARLATLEKKRANASGRRRKSSEGDPSDLPAAGDAVPRLTDVSPQLAAAALDARLKDLREVEASLQVEKLALHTRLRAAEQEEVLLRNETQTLHVKMRSFKAISLRLREQESELARAAADLKARQEAFEREKQVLEQSRQEIEQIKGQLERERDALRRSAAVPATAPVVTGPAAMSSPAEPTTALVRIAPPVEPSPLRLWIERVSRLFSVTALSIAAVVAVSVAIAWLTVHPMYRATAIIAPAGTSIDSSSPAGHFTQPVLAESIQLLAQRGLRPFDTPEAMAAALEKNLTVALGPNRALALSYESPDRDMAVFVLDAASRSYVKVHAGAGSRITQAAAADLFPYRDDRITWAVTWFIGLLGLSIVAAGAALLVRSKLAARRMAKPAAPAAAA